jgi:hypothetical protein
MATRYDDFSAYSTGVITTVASTNWASQAAPGGDWTRNVTSDGAATGGKTLVITRTGSATAESTLVDNTIAGTTGDIEVVQRIKTASVPDSSYPLGACLVATTGASYAIGWNGATTVSLFRYGVGGSTSNTIGSQTITWASNTYYWIRIGRVGTTIHANIGTTIASVDSASWQISGTDATLTTVKGGLQTFEFGWTPYTVDVFGIGTGTGVHAPTSSGGGSSVVLLAQTHYRRRRVTV